MRGYSLDVIRLTYKHILRVKDRDHFPMVLVGNKCDTPEYTREVSEIREVTTLILLPLDLDYIYTVYIYIFHVTDNIRFESDHLAKFQSARNAMEPKFLACISAIMWQLLYGTSPRYRRTPGAEIIYSSKLRVVLRVNISLLYATCNIRSLSGLPTSTPSVPNLLLHECMTVKHGFKIIVSTSWAPICPTVQNFFSQFVSRRPVVFFSLSVSLLLFIIITINIYHTLY